MGHIGHTAVDEGPQVVAEWINLLCEDLEWSEKDRAYLLLTETLHAVRDYLGVNEAADLAAQLPMVLRGIYYTGWDPSRTPVRPRSKTAFLERVSSRFRRQPLDDPERAVAAVFDLLRRKASIGEIEQVSNSMRAPLRDLWW
ncbi:DUF2267 domain-containing protein [Histidinibacterium aquaticum]|uniref:DUF2267 domain-containing protein n=1 Tax=Histidinibacterium aquaticum TaxID=2613962 RepID=A0A5J5GG17_9RHOB|nr:DUF2267 domain-containing protein [Histidinibacterium aquaticum]KAA9006702.1 DUF2267 domain-containing protein [Histidinibacterium aquaticum]